MFTGSCDAVLSVHDTDASNGRIRLRPVDADHVQSECSSMAEETAAGDRYYDCGTDCIYELREKVRENCEVRWEKTSEDSCGFPCRAMLVVLEII